MSTWRPVVFVRWKRQSVGRRCMTWPPNERMLYAGLFESQHVGGKMRQRMVRCLVAIRGGQLVYPTSLTRFWWDVDCTVTDLRLDDDERQVLEARIAAVLPRPDAAGAEQRRMETGALTTAIAAMCTRRGKPRRPAVETGATELPAPVTSVSRRPVMRSPAR